ncbi:MAG: hypothetical protein ACXWRG_16005 [Bdellovibrio sp.]
MTDNASLTDTDKKSDFLMSLGTTNTFKFSEQTFGLRLGYRDYNKEKTNDVLSWGLSDQVKCLTDITCSIQLKGQEYVYGEPMSTDYSYSNYGAAASIAKMTELNSRTTFDLTGSYEGKDYYSQKRFDNIFSTQIVLGYEPEPVWYLEGLAEAGLDSSSNSDYSSVYFDLAGTLEYHFNKKWVATGDIDVKETSFLSRSVTTTATITRGNKVINTQSTAKEYYNAVSAGAELNHQFNTNSKAGISLYNRKQKSYSGYQDYSETEILAKVFINY